MKSDHGSLDYIVVYRDYGFPKISTLLRVPQKKGLEHLGVYTGVPPFIETTECFHCSHNYCARNGKYHDSVRSDLYSALLLVTVAMVGKAKRGFCL